MGAIGGLLGTAGGVSGTGISGPGEANIQQGVTTAQTGDAYKSAQQALAQQQALLDALRGQGGIANQSNVYNQTQNLAGQLAGANGVGNQSAAMAQQQALNQQLAANNGAANLGQVYGQGQDLAGQLAGAGAVANQSGALSAQQQLAQQQQATAQQYQNIANGTGPNPAQMALNNATGQNVANQAALMAGQRGAGSNIGLIARQAAQVGSNLQQQAAGQSAEMQAQQQIAGLSGLSQQQQAIGNTNQSVAGIAGQQLSAQQAQQAALAAQAAQQVGLQQAGTSAQAQQAAAQVAQQQAQQQALAAQAAGQVNQQTNATTELSKGQQAEQGTLLGGLNAQNTAAVGSQGSVNTANAGIAGTQMKGQQDMIGGIMQGAGAAAGMMAEGGPVETANSNNMSIGSPAQGPAFNPTPAPAQTMSVGTPVGPASSFGQFILNRPVAPATSITESAPMQKNSGDSDLKSGAASLAKKSLTSAMMAAKGGLASSGGHVSAKTPAQKAVKKGNSYDNDKIPAMLSEGEVVIPRDVMQSKDPARSAADFVAKVIAKRGRVK